MNETLLRINLLKDFLGRTNRARQQLLDELIDNATDSTLRMRRIRMLQNLSMIEADMIKKIGSFTTDDINDWHDPVMLYSDIPSVINRSA